MMTEIVARQYTRTSLPVEAMQVEMGNLNFVAAWSGGTIHRYGSSPRAGITISDIEIAYVGDYILKSQGLFTVCARLEFESQWTRAQVKERRRFRLPYVLRKGK